MKDIAIKEYIQPVLSIIAGCGVICVGLYLPCKVPYFNDLFVVISALACTLVLMVGGVMISIGAFKLEELKKKEEDQQRKQKEDRQRPLRKRRFIIG